MRRAIKRKVVSVSSYHNPGYEKSRFVGGSNWLTLECGHAIHQKLSRKVPQYVFCLECENLKSGNGRRTSFNTERRMAHYETWDEKTGLPIKHERPMTAEEIAYWGNK